MKLTTSRVFPVRAIRRIGNRDRNVLARNENLQLNNCQIIEELKSGIMANIKDENQ